MKNLIGALLLLASAGMAMAQVTTVTATVVDSDSTAWANGTFTAFYAPVPSSPGPLTNSSTGQVLTPNPVAGTLNGSGALSIGLPQTKYIFGPNQIQGNSPGVIFSVCPQVAPTTCYTTGPIKITGSTQSVSAQINAVIVAPRITGLIKSAQAYNDAEVAAVEGNQYTRLSDGTRRCYSTGAWGTCGGGSMTWPSGAGYALYSGSSSWGTGHLTDNGTTVASSLAFTAPSVQATGTTPGAMSVTAGSGNIAALQANSAGFAAPASGGTAYLFKMPATAVAGILHAAAPGTVDGVNESALTSSAVNLTADVSGQLPNANLANPATTVNGQTCTLGASCTVSAVLPSAAINTVVVGPADVPGGAAATMTAVASPSPLYFYDPRKWVYLFEDFMGQSSIYDYGNYYWNNQCNTITPQAAAAGTAGVIQCTTTASSGNYGYFKGPGAVNNPVFTGLSSTTGDFIFRVALQQTVTSSAFFGLSTATNPGDTGSGFMGIAYDTAASDTGWMCVGNNAGTKVRTAVTGTLDTGFHDLRIRLTNGGFACSIDGGTETAITSTYTPTVALEAMLSLKTNTTSIESFQADYVFINYAATR